MKLKLPYGLNGEVLLTIDEVSAGLACNCVCPCCQKPLIAKKGATKIHHFAHFKSPECRGGLETPLHRICKDILLQKRAFTLPPYFSSRGGQMTEAITITAEAVSLEKRLGDMVPDIVITCDGRQLLVEIEVSHPVDERKLRKIRKAGLPAIAVDARQLLKERFASKDFFLTDEGFQQALVYGTGFKKWLYNPKFKAIERQQAKEKARRKEEDFLQHNYIKAPRGRVKEFMSFRKRDGRDLFYVADCPIEARTWKSGPQAGRAYASSDDCKHCAFCAKLELRPHPRTDFVKYLFPNRVDCTCQLSKPAGFSGQQVSGPGPKAFFQQQGRFLVIDHRGDEQFFLRFIDAYNHYLQREGATIVNAVNGQLIEQKR